MEFLLEIGISNAVISLAIASIAVIVGRFTKRPHLAHLLWLLVLAKLLMPAIIPVSYSLLPNQQMMQESLVVPTETAPVIASTLPGPQIADMPAIAFFDILPMAKSFGLAYLPLIWGSGILISLAWSVFRVVRFDRHLRAASESANPSIYEMATGIANELSLKKIPSIYTTTADISPMVWWVGRKVKVIIPLSLIQKMEPGQLRLVLAHELAHVKRRDFLVRWVEWAAGVLFWWNPVVWWAQRNLRANEEICCDALVLSKLNPKPRDYAASLISAVESFSAPAFRPPAMASEVNSGGFLIRRIHMILSSNNKQTLKGKIQIAVLAAAALVLPLGLTFAQETQPELEKRVEKIREEVKSGKKSKNDANKEIIEIKRNLEIHLAKKKLKAAVKAGKLSEKEAEKKLESIKKYQITRLHRTAKLREAMDKLKAAHIEGKISKEDAEKHMHELKLHHVQEKQEMELHLVTEKLRSAVEARKMSQIEATAQLSEIKRRFKQSAMMRNRQVTAERLKQALKEGKISEVEVERRMIELERRHESSNQRVRLERAAEKLEKAVRLNEISRESAEVKMRALQLNAAESESNASIKNAAKSLKIAIETGKLSKKEAAERMKELRMRHEYERRMLNFERAQEKLEAAVRSGKLSQDEAKAKLIELEKKLKNKKDN